MVYVYLFYKYCGRVPSGQPADLINLFFSFIFVPINWEVTWGCNAQLLKIHRNHIMHTTGLSHRTPLNLSSLKSLHTGRLVYLEACKPAVVVAHFVRATWGRRQCKGSDDQEATWAAQQTHGCPVPQGWEGKHFPEGKRGFQPFQCCTALFSTANSY